MKTNSEIISTEEKQLEICFVLYCFICSISYSYVNYIINACQSLLLSFLLALHNCVQKRNKTKSLAQKKWRRRWRKFFVFFYSFLSSETFPSHSSFMLYFLLFILFLCHSSPTTEASQSSHRKWFIAYFWK
jgi:hypothetical protein